MTNWHLWASSLGPLQVVYVTLHTINDAVGHVSILHTLPPPWAPLHTNVCVEIVGRPTLISSLGLWDFRVLSLLLGTMSQLEMKKQVVKSWRRWLYNLWACYMKWQFLTNNFLIYFLSQTTTFQVNVPLKKISAPFPNMIWTNDIGCLKMVWVKKKVRCIVVFFTLK